VCPSTEATLLLSLGADVCLQVVKYWPEKGKSGFNVWRYLLRRDDPSPAPWTNAGKRRVEELGLTMRVMQRLSYLLTAASNHKQRVAGVLTLKDHTADSLFQ